MPIFNPTDEALAPTPAVGVHDLMDMIRRSFLQEVRWIEANHSTALPHLQAYYDVVRRSRLQTVRWIERQRGHPGNSRRERNRKRPVRDARAERPVRPVH